MRGSTWDIAGRTSNPERALANLVARDELFTNAVVKEATALRLAVITVDGALSLDDLTGRVAQSLGLS
jgi:hypothetical protein